MTEIYDPLKIFDDETAAQEAGVKDPITGIREPHNKAERGQRKENEIQRRSDVKKRIIVYLMQSDYGREWLYDQLILSNAFGTPFTADDRMTAYNSGAMYIGKMLERDIKRHALTEYLQMLKEGMEREQMWNDLVEGK